jgi:hypothetical protein
VTRGVDPNYCDEAGARLLAARIGAYWAARGKSPRIWIEREELPLAVREIGSGVWVVRSDMGTRAPSPGRTTPTQHRAGGAAP